MTVATERDTLLPGAHAREVAVEGVRFLLHRADPPKRTRETPVLLLHGVPETAVSWRHLVPELARDRVVLAPDLKGLGGSEVVGPYDVPTLVRELAALVLHEVDGAVDVVGHDWGGALGLALAGARPDLVRRLVVINAPYRHINLLRAAYIPFFSLPVLPEALFAAAGKRAVYSILGALWKADRQLEPEVAAHYAEAYSQADRVRAMLGYYRAATRGKVVDLVRRRISSGEITSAVPRNPVRAQKHLVVWGALDPVLPLRVGETVMRDLGADTVMVTVPGVGHFPLEEAPDVVVPRIADFLREGDDRSTAAELPADPSAGLEGSPDEPEVSLPVAPPAEPVTLDAPAKAAAATAGKAPATKAATEKPAAEAPAKKTTPKAPAKKTAAKAPAKKTAAAPAKKTADAPAKKAATAAKAPAKKASPAKKTTPASDGPGDSA